MKPRLAGIAVLWALAVPAIGQGYPARPLRLLVGYPAGGGSDIVARLVAQALGDALGQQVVVDNRPGAATMLATTLGARSSPDGYTVLFVSASHAINPSLFAKVQYDPVKDFAPVSLVASTPFLLVVQAALPVTTVKDLIALARAKAGEINYSSGGSGSTGHLAAELFKSMAGVGMQHIPYKGLAPALTDLLAGRVTLTFASLPSVLQHMRAGRLRALGVTTSNRLPTHAELPTLAESGLPGYEVDQWFGLLLPAGAPPVIVDRLHAAVVRSLAPAELKERFAAAGAFPVTSSSRDFAGYIRSELAKWAKIVSVSGARAD